jgi:aryl-alcohol dehydrogenase-like predicted oxidoreductase
MECSRRRFLGTAGAGLGMMLLNGHRVTWASGYADSYHDPYEMVELGQTGIRTTRLCMGTGIRGGGRQSNLIRLGYEQAIQFVREIYMRGVRMFDLADSYGTHAVVGDALKIYPRSNYVLFTKLWFARGTIPETERPDAETVVARFLRELQTDYIDGVQLHCVTSANWNSQLSDYMTALDRLKQRGVIRSHGLSCHSLSAVQTATAESWVDAIHVRINPYSTKMDDKTEQVEPVVKQLHQAGKGVIGIKLLGEGAFAKSDEQRDVSFHYALQLGSIDVLDVGMDKISDIIDTESRIRKVPRF